MNIELTFKEGTFVAKKGQLAYKEVVDDFDNASMIRIVTFNLSRKQKDDKLFERLMQLEDYLDIQIITNIPSRFDTYYKSKPGEYIKNSASKNINAYLKKLNPSDFQSNIIPFFNFNNHSKVIGTDNIVYVGSANFSNESAKNYETGVVIRDKDFIKSLYSTFFEELKEKSVPYFDDDFNKLRLFVISILTRFVNHYNYILESMFFLQEDNKTWVFKQDETNVSINDLYEIIYDLHELRSIETLVENIDIESYNLEDAVEVILQLFSDMNIQYLIDISDEGTDIYDYINWDFQDSFNDCFEKYSGVAYDEDFEEYVKKSSDESRDILSRVIDDIEKFKMELERIINNLKKITIIINEYSEKAVNIDIDNTK